MPDQTHAALLAEFAKMYTAEQLAEMRDLYKAYRTKPPHLFEKAETERAIVRDLAPAAESVCPCEAVKWNPYNSVTQCHRCGQVFSYGPPPPPPWDRPTTDSLAARNDTSRLSAAINDFVAWLTSQDVPVTLSARHDAGVGVEAISAFCTAQGWDKPDDPSIAEFREHYPAPGWYTRAGEPDDPTMLSRIIDAVAREREALRAEKNKAYVERNQCVALVARLVFLARQALRWVDIGSPGVRSLTFSTNTDAVSGGVKVSNWTELNAGLGKHDSADLAWDDDWRNVVYIDLPAGQISFHIHDRELPLFAFLPPYTDAWDGHDDATKWQRVREPGL